MACNTVKVERTANIRQKVIFLEMEEDSKAPLFSYAEVIMVPLASYAVEKNKDVLGADWF